MTPSAVTYHGHSKVIIPATRSFQGCLECDEHEECVREGQLQQRHLRMVRRDRRRTKHSPSSPSQPITLTGTCRKWWTSSRCLLVHSKWVARLVSIVQHPTAPPLHNTTPVRAPTTDQPSASLHNSVQPRPLEMGHWKRDFVAHDVYENSAFQR